MSTARLPAVASAARRRAAGFTLIELLVAITIAAILLALAAPSFEDAGVSGKVSDIATKVAVTANTARSEAIKRNGRVVMCVSTDGASCAGSGSWEQGWIAFLDRNQNGTREANADPTLDDVIIVKESAVAGGYKVIEGSGQVSLSFPSTGIGVTTAAYTVCRATPSVGKQQRTVHVGPTGKGSVTKFTGTTCA